MPVFAGKRLGNRRVEIGIRERRSTLITTIVIVMAIYFISMIVISWMGKKHASNFDSYLNMGRSGGVLLIMGGAIGAHIGNGLVVGGAGEGAAVGFSGAAYGFGCALSYVILAFCISNFMYRGGYLTLADYLRKRYKSEIPAQVYNVATVLSYLGILGAQLMAGKALFIALGLNGTAGVIVIAVVVLLYSQISGLWGAFATSVVQTLVIAAGLIVSVIVLISIGAMDLIRDAVATGAVPETFTSFTGGYDAATMMLLIIPVALSIFTDQCTFQRVNSAKSAGTSKIAHLLAAAVIIPLSIAPTFVGMYGAVKFGATGNDAFFSVVMNILPPVAAALIVTAVVAAVMSTIDSALIAFSAVLLNDIYKGYIDRDATPEKLSKMTLGLNIGVTVIGIVIALSFGSIVSVLSNTYMFLCAACLIPFLGGILWKKGTPSGAVASSIVGVGFELLELLGIYALPYSTITVFIPSLIAFAAVSMMTQKQLID